MTRFDIYGIGAALVDTEYSTNDQFLTDTKVEKGLMTLVDEARQQDISSQLSASGIVGKRASGGSACNTVFAASCFGATTFYSGKVAKDDDGDFFIHDLNDANISFHCDALDNGTTGKCLVLITPDAERSMNTFLGANDDFNEADIDFDALAQSKTLYIEGYLVSSETRKQTAIKAREFAEQNGVKTALSLSDPAMVQFFGEGMRDMIGSGVDLLFCNLDEAKMLTDTDSVEAAAEALKQYCKGFAITCGAEGACVFDGHTLQQVAGTSVDAIDTNGAGDMFAGAFLYALDQGKSFATAAAFANNAAAAVVSQYGPRLAASQHTALLEALA